MSVPLSRSGWAPAATQPRQRQNCQLDLETSIWWPNVVVCNAFKYSMSAVLRVQENGPAGLRLATTMPA
jgi:hypothetical protein